MEVLIERVKVLSADLLAPLVIESEEVGLRFVRRLADEWTAGINLFAGPGEALFGAWVGGRLVGLCGLNIDPWALEPGVGRVRHLYVLAEFRHRGIGKRLVDAVVTAARGRFRRVRLRTESAEAAAFYERLGFRRAVGTPGCTHGLELE